MRRLWLLVFLACGPMMSLGALPAEAALTLCNRTSYILYAATSAIQSPRSETQGWTRITPGECQLTRKEPLIAETYLVHARTSLAHSGPSRAWGGAYPVCVKDTSFAIKQAVTQPTCTAEDTFALPFASVGNRGKSIWTMNFDETPAMSLDEALLAGVKRLLKDDGYKLGVIDGRPDKTTGLALADFRRRTLFNANAGNAELFAALEREAGRKIAPAGYTVCNESREALLVALGRMDDGKPVSRGWWTVQPNSCAKTVTTPLNGKDVFLLAQRKNGATVVGGTQKFCTASVIFEIRGAENCAARGLVEALFAVTSTRGASGYVARIGPSGLKP